MNIIQANLVLLGAAAIWGFAFSAQILGMNYIDPFTYTAIRFFLGSFTLLLVLFLIRSFSSAKEFLLTREHQTFLFRGGILASIGLYGGISLQQIALMETTTAKAGFITGLYLFTVPLIGLLWRQYPDLGTWLGAGLALIGLYLLTMTNNWHIQTADFLVLLSVGFWTLHVLVIGHYSQLVQPLYLALFQYTLCATASFIVALVTENIAWSAIQQAAIPILYGGVLSVGVGYTLQIIGQRYTHPTHAAIIMSLEAVFAALGGWLILNEYLSSQALLGCILMLIGMILAQLGIRWTFFIRAK